MFFPFPHFDPLSPQPFKASVPSKISVKHLPTTQTQVKYASSTSWCRSTSSQRSHPSNRCPGQTQRDATANPPCNHCCSSTSYCPAAWYAGSTGAGAGAVRTDGQHCCVSTVLFVPSLRPGPRRLGGPKSTLNFTRNKSLLTSSCCRGVAVGSSIGHAIGGFFGGGSSAPAETQQQSTAVAQPQDGSYQSNSWGAARSCETDAKSFTKCLDENSGNMQVCGWYLDQLKACQAAASQY